MGDLISRSALIEDLKKWKGLNQHTLEAVLETIEKQDTAYDVECVVAELEWQKEQCEKDSEYWMEHPWKDKDIFNEYDVSNKKADCYEEAITIVKKGGVE